MTDQANAEKEVMKVHKLFWDSLAKRDIDLRFSVCAEDITFIGTGLHERATNKTEYKKINDEGVKQFPGPLQLNFLWTHFTLFNDVAWVECEVEWGQNINAVVYKELVRNTTILKYEGTRWLVVHVHGSSPDYRLTEGAYISNEKTVDRNRELERQVFERTWQLNKSLEELKAAQTQLIHSEKMASLGELTAGIAHEIQNPLNFVNNFSEVNSELIEEMQQAIRKGNFTEAAIIATDIKENEDKINHHGKRAGAIVKSMLQHSGSNPSQKEPTDINALVDEYLRLTYHGIRAKDKHSMPS